MAHLKLAAFAALLSLAACSASAQQEEYFAPAPTVAAHVAPAAHVEASYRGASVTCDVTARRTSNGMLIEAHAFADRGVNGEYSLTITKTGRAGSSDISQGGALSLVAGEEATLGQNEISVERGARVRALLTIHDDRGEICRETFRL